MDVILDTCTLINFVKKDADYHREAVMCIQALSAKKHRLHLSSLTLAEYGVKGDSGYFLNPKKYGILPYSTQHALTAAEFLKETLSAPIKDGDNSRKIITIDTHILAQAQVAGVDYVLTVDRKTMAKTASILIQKGIFSPQMVLLSESPMEKMGLLDDVHPTLNLEFGSEN